jgi:hypothetical protein
VKPTAVCLTSTTLKLLPVDLNQDGLIDTAIGQVWAEELNVSSYDNCFKDIDFRIRIKGTGSVDAAGNLKAPDSTQNSLGFGCEDIGLQEVEMWVVDAAGNGDFCVVAINVQPPVEGCRNELGKIKGTVSSMQGAGISGVQMIIQDAGEGRWITDTDNHGQYDFSSFAMDGTNHLLWAEKSDEAINGISTLDVIRISKHLLSKEPLTNGFEFMAADANGDGNVSVLDIINLRKLILGKIDVLPNAKPWQFYNVEMEEVSEISLGIDYKPLTKFTGIKVGDVNGDITNYSSQGRSGPQSLILHYPDQSFVQGQLVDMTFSVDSVVNLEGLQLELSYDPHALEVVEVTGESMNISTEEFELKDDRVAVSWIDIESQEVVGSLMLIKFRARKDGRLSNLIALDRRRIRSEAYTDLQATIPISLLATNPEGNSITLGQNFPNPFHTQTYIAITCETPTEGTLRVFNLSGRLFYEKTAYFNAGENQIPLSSKELGGQGMYVYEFSTANSRQIRKMVLSQ